jgi:hypothetical protein
MPRDDEILESLTNEGTIPVEYCFVHKNLIHYWNPRSRMLMQKSFRNDDFAMACIQYLYSRGQVCENREQIEDMAKLFNWQNWGQPSTFFD